MHIWKLSAGDPLQLSLAADPRLGKTNYANDIIWEMSLGQTEPAALAVQTTFGLRARSMLFFPCFTRAGKSVVDPAEFFRPPLLRTFYSNWLAVDFSPFEGVDVEAEYWTPDSEVLAGRLRFTNKSVLTQNLRLDWAGLLSPLGVGDGMAALPIGMSTVLQGHTGGMYVVCFLTGGPQASKGPYPGLGLNLDLYPGNVLQVQWAVAMQPEANAALEMARAATSRAWDAETARIELQNAADQPEISTGDPQWDAALALAQKSAFGLLMENSSQLPFTSFVLTRRPDQGASARGDGSDHPYLWSGQTALDSFYLAELLLPGAPALVRGWLNNFIAVQTEQGFADWRPGLGGQRSRHLAQPMLASLALKAAPCPADAAWLAEIFPGLLQFFRTWLSAEHDRDGGGLPEWEHPLQTGLESSPLYSRWRSGDQGVEVTSLESPALGAMLYGEALSLMEMAHRCMMEADLPWLEEQAERLRGLVEDSWDAAAHTYRYRDALTHLCLPGKELASFNGSGNFHIGRRWRDPQRLVMEFFSQEDATRAVRVMVSGQGSDGQRVSEEFTPRDIAWSGRRGWLTTHQVYTRVYRITVDGLPADDHGLLHTADLTRTDISLYLPLWAHIPSPERAAEMLGQIQIQSKPFGLPMCPSVDEIESPTDLTSTALPWNALVLEGLLDYGFRIEAADLYTRMMQAAVNSLKQERCFRQFYHAESGRGRGERGHLWGLPPIELFLRLVGIKKFCSDEIIVEGHNPFPWPVTIKFRRLSLTRDGDKTTLRLPGKPPIQLVGPEAQRISLL